MANDAFALSPISASSTLPSEADYEAISEAFMETARGRWFLKEYARRNRNTDTTMVLEAVARIEATMAAQKREAELAAAPTADAVSDAVAQAVTNILDAVRNVFDEAKAAVARAAGETDREQALAPSRKGVRIIREVAWRLREVGYDARICDILEAQADAIGASSDVLQAETTHAAALVSFDLIGQRLDELAGADPAATTPPTSAKAPPAPADLAEARLAREKSASADAAPTQSASSPLPENVVSLAPVKPPAPVQEPVAPPVIEEPVTENPATEELVTEDLVTEDLTAEDLTAEDQAADDAVLAAIRAAMATDAEDPAAIAEAPAAMTTALPPVLPPSPAAPAPAVAAERTAAPLSAPSQPDEVAVPALPATIEAPAATAHVETAAPVVAAAPAPAAPLSLGKSLLARGMVSPSRTDPLAPVRRMSQAEKIAFFS